MRVASQRILLLLHQLLQRGAWKLPRQVSAFMASHAIQCPKDIFGFIYLCLNYISYIWYIVIWEQKAVGGVHVKSYSGATCTTTKYAKYCKMLKEEYRRHLKAVGDIGPGGPNLPWWPPTQLNGSRGLAASGSLDYSPCFPRSQCQQVPRGRCDIPWMDAWNGTDAKVWACLNELCINDFLHVHFCLQAALVDDPCSTFYIQ